MDLELPGSGGIATDRLRSGVSDASNLGGVGAFAGLVRSAFAGF